MLRSFRTRDLRGKQVFKIDILVNVITSMRNNNREFDDRPTIMGNCFIKHVIHEHGVARLIIK